MTIGGNCQGPKVKFNIDPKAGQIQIRQKDGGVYGPWMDIDETEAIPCDVGALQARLVSATDMVTGWKTPDALITNNIMTLNHRRDITIDVITAPIPKITPDDFPHPSTDENFSLAMVGVRLKKFLAWVDGLPMPQ